MYTFIKKHFFLISLLIACLIILFVNIKINNFRYHNFDMGKFDLGNMTQMVWNASKGRGLMLTDYFGTNMPRWGMSHVDPILYLVVPFFWVFPHALTLVYFQLLLVIFASVLVFFIAKMILKSEFAAFLLALAYLLNPSIGFLTAWTGFHGVTAVIPFFFGAFYVFEKMYRQNKFTKKGIFIFWVLLILTMMGKEQIPLYVFLYGLFIFIFRRNDITKKLSISVMIVSVLWFIYAFFILIPKYADVRVQGYLNFAETIGLTDSNVRDVALPNYFLNRYDEFGDSYFEIAQNVILNPNKAISVFFGGDKVENFVRTFQPLAFLPFAFPAFLIIAFPDMGINYLTTAGGIGTSEITNHRISMILPVLFISAILGIRYLSKIKIKKIKSKQIVLGLSILVFGFTLYTTHVYNNPVYLWLQQATYKRVVSKVFAKTDKDLAKSNLEIGEVVRLSELEDKDRECALKIVELIPDKASVSGPDSLGSHLALRETYAIFPSLYNSADYVIVDVFAQKILRILDVDIQLNRDVVEDLIKDDNYKLQLGCGNYFVFKKVGPHGKDTLLPIQEKFSYEENLNYEFFQKVFIVDYDLPKEFSKGETKNINIVYFREDDRNNKDTSLEQFIMFTSFINKKTGEIYQQANLPSFAITKPSDWVKQRYYIENIEIVVPEFLEEGNYKAFVGMGNKIRTRSMYLGDVVIQ